MAETAVLASPGAIQTGKTGRISVFRIWGKPVDNSGENSEN
jgi:hypothetical protein